ncbi:MAG: hypothetical protein JRI94_00070 [Deltaproteobacteria bacterium]|nr:hypothetical protein [Deltaproteobacteria bacterium]MBW2031977.1 hypothetical protein [Deltaproteobacteria bacterium]
MKRYGAILAILGSLVVLGSVVVGAYTQFTTKERHVLDHQAQQLEIAGVSLFQQQVSTQQQIKWLEQDLREYYRKYGKPPYSDPEVQLDYEKLKRDLDDERAALRDIRNKIKK